MPTNILCHTGFMRRIGMQLFNYSLEALYFASCLLLRSMDVAWGIMDITEHLDPRREPYYTGFAYTVVNGLSYPCYTIGALLFIRFVMQRRWLEAGSTISVVIGVIVALTARIYLFRYPDFVSGIETATLALIALLNAFLLIRSVRAISSIFRKQGAEITKS